MSRAYSLFHVKSLDSDKREISGLATSPETDRQGDVVEPSGAVYKLPIPLLWGHDHNKPIGEVVAAKTTSEGIEVQAKLAKTATPGTLKDRLDEAWESLKIGLVRGFSIGFNPLEVEPIPGSYGSRFKRWEFLELSAVTIPANQAATIQTVKSFDLNRRTQASWPPKDGSHQIAKTAVQEADRLIKDAKAKGHDPAKFLACELYSKSGIQKLFRTYSEQRFNEFEQRMAMLEAKLAEKKGMEYCGTWQHDDHYLKGNFVTHHGSVWHANSFNQREAPGSSDAWTLAVKRGNSGRAKP